MRILNLLITLSLLGLIIKSVIIIVRDMDSRKKMITNGIIVLFLSFIIYASLISYSPKADFTENFGGVVGAAVAESIYETFGVSSYLLPLILVIAAIALFTNRVKYIFYRVGGLFLWVVTISFMSISIAPKLPAEKKGEIGIAINSFLISKLSFSGSIALICFLALIIVYIYLQPKSLKINISPLIKRLKKILPKKKEKSASLKTEEENIKKTTTKKATKKKTRKSRAAHSTNKSYDEFRKNFLEALKDPVEVEWMPRETVNRYKKIIEDKLESFSVSGKIKGVLRGPVVSRFEFKPDPGIKLSKISNLANDLALALRAEKIRIIAPIPGKGVVGIEVPNKNRETVFLKDFINNETFKKEKSITYVPIGKDITGNPFYYPISSMPHILIAGATGSGKSVFINSIITSLLYRATPEEIRFILIDPKRIELSVYNGIPHLIRSVINDHATAVQYLNQSIKCMEKRYKEFARVGVRNIEGYNNKIKDKKPYIFIIIDELADLMMRSGKDVENAIIRLAQMSRAVGIHLILATQRPSVDVITGLIKANFPARVAFQVASGHDSKTILDAKGAEKLLGNGDMLFVPPDEGVSRRLHGPFITIEETKKIVSIIGLAHLRKLLEKHFEKPEKICSMVDQEEMLGVLGDRSLPGAAERIEQFSKYLNINTGVDENEFTEFVDELDYYPPTEEIEEFLEMDKETEELEEVDEFYNEAKEIVISRQSASVSLLQRKLKVGYARAGRIIDQLEKTGIVGKFRGSKPREVLVKREEKK